jgi:hypothetical protein
MNLTNGSTFSTSWKRIRLQHLTAISGAALAASAFIAIGGLGTYEAGRSVPPGEPRRAAAQMSAARTQDMKEFVYYVVDGPELARALGTAISESAGNPVPNDQHPAASRQSEVLVVDTPEGELALRRLQLGAYEVAQEGNVLSIVDLRD